MFNHIKIKNFYLSKDTFKVRRQVTNLEIFAIHRTGKGLVHRMCEELIQISNNRIEKCVRHMGKYFT